MNTIYATVATGCTLNEIEEAMECDFSLFKSILDTLDESEAIKCEATDAERALIETEYGIR